MAARRIASEIVEALVPDVVSRFSELSKASDEELAAFKAEWVEMALSKFRSHSIEWDRKDPLSSSITSRNPDVVEQYLVKYPKLRPWVQRYEELALSLWAESKTWLEIHSDPEGCHVCCEGQRLWMHVYVPWPENDYKGFMAETEKFHETLYDDPEHEEFRQSDEGWLFSMMPEHRDCREEQEEA